MRSPTRSPGRTASATYLAAQGKKSLLRFLTCGSVDDGKSTLIGRLLYDTKLIFDDQLAALETRFQEARHQWRRHRFRAAGRRAGGRARAGHHDRRRLPLLRHAEAQVHRRRHARPRTIYAQHGDRRLDRRRCGRAGRRTARRAGADAAALDHRLAARHQPCRARDQQDRPGRLRPGRVRPDLRRLRRVRGSSSASRRSNAIPMSARFGDNVTKRSDQTPWYSGPTLLGHLETIDVDDADATGAVPFPGSICQPTEPRFSWLCRNGRVGLDRHGRNGCRGQVGPRLARRAHRHP